MTESLSPIEVFTLKNRNGMEVSLLNYGASIQSIKVPDRHGQIEGVVLGYDDPQAYGHDQHYFGSTVGRFANRIAHGRFEIDNTAYQVSKNHGDHHIHGGEDGFSHRIWRVGEDAEEGQVSFLLQSADGDQGYPGNMTVGITYTLNDQNQLVMYYVATTDQSTPVNLTNHAYFNLNGQSPNPESDNILDHEVQINASHYLPVDQQLMPLGHKDEVTQTPFDFRQKKLVKQDIGQNVDQLTLAGGFDHCWVIDQENPSDVIKAAEVYAPQTGRRLMVLTDQPGIQFYTGNAIQSGVAGKNGKIYDKHSGFCLETQHFPDSPNQSTFPTTILHPDQIYQTTTIYQFDVD